MSAPGLHDASGPMVWATAAVRAWTRIYTARMRPTLREARRAEIESDLWESLHDPDAPRGVAAGVHMLVRLAAGIPHDLAWRAEHATGDEARSSRAIIVTAAAAALLFATLWALPALLSPNLPSPPRPPETIRVRIPPHPPPPPQLMRCRPPAFTQGCIP